jgi:hypothetical protein
MQIYLQRLIRACKLEPGLYEEVEADKKSFNQAMLTVILSSVAAGIGTITTGKFIGMILSTVIALISWLIWAYLVYIIGTKLLPEKQTNSNTAELLRTIGFSSAPGIIRVLGIISSLRSSVFFIASIWMLASMIIAIRQALDYKSTLRAVQVCVLGWIVQILLVFLISYVV